MRTRVLLLPAIADVDVFRDLVTRTAVHLGHAEPENVTFLVEPSIRPDLEKLLEAPEPPPDFDPEAGEAVARMVPSITLADSTTVDREALAVRSDFILVWDTAAVAASDWVIEESRRTRRVGWFDVDARTNRLEASEWAVLGERIANPSPAVEARRFGELVRRLPPTPRATLFGTGPSVMDSLQLDVSASVRLACNTVILDDELMGHLNPHIVVCADPVFHFGPSHYAAEYRRVLRRRLAAAAQLVAIVPLRYRPFLVDLMPEAEDRIIGIPLLPTTDRMVLDLSAEFAVAPLPNILTLLMLPIAATLANEIDVIGFDGRGPGETKFWQHGHRVQMHDLMPTVERLHPAFFGLDHVDYYHQHVTTVESMVQSCEAKGIIVSSLAPSFSAPFARRLREPGWPEPSWTSTDTEAHASGPLIVWIDPDWVDDFGHHGPWFRRLSAELEDVGASSVWLTSRALPAAPRVLPTFTHPSTNPRAALAYAPVFEAELSGALDRLTAEHPERDIVLAFYTADVHHLAPIARTAMRYPGRVRGWVNLMRAHRDLVRAASHGDPTSEAWAHALAALIRLSAATGIHVTADTPEQAALIAEVTGRDVGLWPMASAADIEPVESDRTNRDLVVYCPSQPQIAKGSLEFAEAAIALLRGTPPTSARFRMRDVRQPLGTSVRVVEAIQRSREAGVEVLTGPLDDAEYGRAITDADIIVVPYRSDPFRTRTSSVVVEAGMAGKPIVAASGTWGARVARERGAIVEFASGDAEDLARAIAEALTRSDALMDLATAGAGSFSEDFSMRGVAAFLADPAGEGADTLADARAIDEAELMLEAFLQGRTDGHLDANAIVHTLHREAMERSVRVDRLTQTGDQLRRAIEYRDDRISSLEAALEELRESHTRQVGERDDRIGILSDRLAAQERAIEDLEATRRNLSSELEELRQLIDERESALDELRRLVADRESEIAELSKRPVNRVIRAVGRRLDRS